MNGLHRREFLKLGTGTLASLASSGLINTFNNGQSTIPSSAQQISTPVHGALWFDEQAIRFIDPATRKVLQTVPWNLPQESTTPRTNLFSPVHVPLDTIEKWSGSEVGKVCDVAENLSTFEASMLTPTVGLPNLSDLIGEAMIKLSDGEPVNLLLDFLYDAKFEFPVGRLADSNDAAQSIASDTHDVFRITTERAEVLQQAPPHITMFGWRLQFRGPDNHPLGSCVTESVKHFNLDVFKQNKRGGYDYVLNVHIGTYKSSGRRCFVLYSSERLKACWKTCTPTWNELKRMLERVLFAAAAAAGVVLAAAAASAIAGAAATALLPLLLIL